MNTDPGIADDVALDGLRQEWFETFDNQGWDESNLSSQEFFVWFGLLKNTGFHGLASTFLIDLGRPVKLDIAAVEAIVRSLEAKDMLRTIEPEGRYSPGVFRLANRPGHYIQGRAS